MDDGLNDLAGQRLRLEGDADPANPLDLCKTIRAHVAVMPDAKVTLVMRADTALKMARAIERLVDRPVPAPAPFVPRLHLDMPHDAAGEVHPAQMIFPDPPRGHINGPMLILLGTAAAWAVLIAAWALS